MFKKTITLAVATVLVLTVALAAPTWAIDWDGEIDGGENDDGESTGGRSTGNDLWSNAGNWVGDVLPAVATGHTANIVGSYSAVLQSAVSAPEINITDGATLTIKTGARLIMTGGDKSYVGNGIGSVGTVLQEGGTIVMGDDLYLGEEGGDGTYTMEGGSLSIGT